MTTTAGWHAPPELLAAYVDGRLDAVLGASLERHVDRCATCRGAVATHVDPPLLAEAWSALRTTVESPPPPWPVRLARRCGLSDATGVVLTATVSLRVAWLSSAFIALAFAVGAATVSGSSGLWPFLLVAPLVPVLGVAAAYGSSEDPFESLAVTTPFGRTRLILTRTVAVLVSTVPVACLLGLALPGPPWVAAAWLGPALAMLPVMMALASFTGPRLAGALLAVAWSGAVLLSTRRLPSTWVVEAEQQAFYAALAVLALVVLVLRSRQTRGIGAVL